MIKKRILQVIVIASLILNTSLNAEGNTTVTKDVNKTEKELNKNSKVEAAKALLEEMGLEKVYKKAVDNSTKRLVEANPKFKKIEDKIRAFYEKAIGWNVMKDDLAALYAKYYTTQELKDITEFYKTKTGKKVLATMGNLTYEGQMLTRKRLMPHMEELKKMLDKVAKEEPKKTKKKEPKKEAKKDNKKTEHSKK